MSARSSTTSPSRIASRGQRDLSEAFEARRVPWRDLGDRDRVGPDVEADQAAGHASPSRNSRLRLEVATEIDFANTEVLADANRGQRAGLDESVHGHRGDPNVVGDFANREQVVVVAATGSPLVHKQHSTILWQQSSIDAPA